MSVDDLEHSGSPQAVEWDPELSGDGSKSDDGGSAGGGSVENISKKGQPWTEAEHMNFLAGLKKMGKGNWRSTSRYFVPSRTPTQVASHAQKHFMRIEGVTKRRSRFCLSDIEKCNAASSPRKSDSTSTTTTTTTASAMPMPTPQVPPIPSITPGLPMQFPMIPAMMFGFPPGYHPSFMPSMPCPPPPFGMFDAMVKQGLVNPWMPNFQAMQAPMMMAMMQSCLATCPRPQRPSTAGICKPQALHAVSMKEMSSLLNHLPSSQQTRVNLSSSMQSAFRPLRPAAATPIA